SFARDWSSDVCSSDLKYAEAIGNLQDEIKRNQQVLIDLQNETQLTVAEIKDVNRRMSIGEAKARRAKKEMVEANLRLVISIAKKYTRSEEHTSELQSRENLVCRLLL